jgi:predicted nucleic acid-binding protein
MPEASEVVYVLSSPVLYNLSRSEVISQLRPIIERRGLELEHKISFLQAIALYERSSLKFEDRLSVAHMRREQLDGVYSYDRGFDRLSEVKRIEP